MVAPAMVSARNDVQVEELLGRKPEGVDPIALAQVRTCFVCRHLQRFALLVCWGAHLHYLSAIMGMRVG